MRQKGAQWPVQWDQFSGQRNRLMSSIRIRPVVCLPVLCVHTVANSSLCACRCFILLPCAAAAVCRNPKLLEKSRNELFTFSNGKQIQIQGQFPSSIICHHFQIKINLPSPCCCPPGLKYFFFECLMKGFLCTSPWEPACWGEAVSACVCVCVTRMHSEHRKEREQSTVT